MFKPCPHCGFLVALIKGREASQRCPRCGSAMLEAGELPPADEAVQDAPPRRGDRPSPRAPDGAEAVQVLDGHARLAPSGNPAPAAHAVAGNEVGTRLARSASDARDPRPAVAAVDEAGRAPSFAARRARGERGGRRWAWAVALPLLALLLGLQLVLSQRAELAQDARWRPLLLALCGALGCDVPAWREPAAFAMLARDVRPHPGRAGVLRVSTSLRNDARWPQPLPTVLLRLSDVDGRVLAARAVPPADYGRRAGAMVGPGDSVDIAFDVREPSPRVVSFDFELH